jgi:hypothetical protein
VESQSVELYGLGSKPSSASGFGVQVGKSVRGGLTAGSLGKRTKTQAAKLMKNNLGSYLT